MGNYKSRDKFGGSRGFNNDRGPRRGGRSDRPEMHQAVCSDCGKDCEVPFRPTGSKPVYCSDCFGKKEDSGGNRFERRDSGRSGSRDKQMFKTVCDKCGKDCEVPFRPTGDKPVYCSDCFGKGDRGGSSKNAGSSNKLEKQFEMLNSKIDDILKILSPKTPAKKTIKKDKPAVKEAKKAVVKKKKAAPKKVTKAPAGKKKK